MGPLIGSAQGVLGTLVYGLGITGAGLLAVAGSSGPAASVRDAVVGLFQNGTLTVPLFDL